MKKLLLVLLFLPLVCFGQTIEEALKRFVEEFSKNLPIEDPRTGVTLSGMTSFGSTLVFLYDVPEEWNPPENMKQTLIENLETSGAGEVYSKSKFDGLFNYYRGSKLLKSISIKQNEYKSSFNDSSSLNFELGESISLKNYPKAKGVNIKIKKPKGFIKMEGDRPNVVTKFNNKENNLVYTVGIADFPVFLSKKEIKDSIFSDDSSVFAKETLSGMKADYISSRYIDIDKYPSLEIVFDLERETLAGKMNTTGIMWSIYYEDKVITLMGGTTKEKFEKFKNVFLKITSSIVLEDQYNSLSNNYVGNYENFEVYLDKFYREIEFFGINKVRPKKINITLEPLESFKESSHLHGFSLGYKNDDIIEIYINKRSWNTFSKAQKHYLIFHELCHDVLNLVDLNDNNTSEKKIMYPSMENYSFLTMDDFIENFHNLLEGYSN